MKGTIKVKIVKADEHSWYKNNIGQVFEVEDFTEHFYNYKKRFGIAKSNCEIINSSQNSEVSSQNGSRK